MFTEVDSFYSFPLTGIIPLEFKLLKSSSLGYLKGSPPPPAEKGGLRLAQGWVGTHTSLNCEGASSRLRSGLSLPPASPHFILVSSTTSNLEKEEGGAGGRLSAGKRR